MSYPDTDKADDRGRVFREYEDALALSEMDTFPMGAPNAQPAKKGKAGTPHTHAPHAAGMPASSATPGDTKGGGKVMPDAPRPKGTPRNKNVLH